MLKQRVITLAVVVVIVIVIFSLRHSPSVGRAEQGIPQDTDAEQIKEVIKKRYEIEAKAGRTFDTTLFDSVFINDARGGELSPSTVDFIVSVTDDAIKSNYGYLDYKLAYYSWWKSGATKFEELKAKADNEKRGITREELASLIDKKGRMAMPRLKGNFVPNQLNFISVEIQGGQATVVFDDGPRTNQMVMIRVDNKWYIAGNKFLSVHP
jgi:hypothetical protein